MNVLHTSDWHIGRSLYGRKRYEEFEAFLSWLAETIEQKEIDVLLVAGDLFDTGTPSHRAQALYYRFLCRVAASRCLHVVVIAGNHDSPSFLNAPGELLKALDVHVVGQATEEPEREVLLLADEQGLPNLIVCAVPYLRDRDIRLSEAGETVGDKEQKLLDGIRKHYAAVFALAEQKRQEQGGNIPIIGMGHLFTAGGRTVEGDGVRELYVGSLAHVSTGIFPDNLDYLALGHLHVPQEVNHSNTMRYSGSPLPMGFGGATQQKSVCLITFHSATTEVTQFDIPCFQQLERIKGGWEDISGRIEELAASHSRAWLEIVYEGDEVIHDLRQRLDGALADTEMELLRVKNSRIITRLMGEVDEVKSLDDLTENEVFQRCLAVHDIPDEQQKQLLSTFQETLASLYEDDSRAE